MWIHWESEDGQDRMIKCDCGKVFWHKNEPTVVCRKCGRSAQATDLRYSPAQQQRKKRRRL